jgi:hypothetical protein
MVMGNNGITNKKKYTPNAGNIDHHAITAVGCRAHRPMEHIRGFM